MKYKILVELSDAWGTTKRYEWALYEWREVRQVYGDNWWIIDSGDSKYKWNAKRSALRAMRRYKKMKNINKETVWTREYE